MQEQKSALEVELEEIFSFNGGYSFKPFDIARHNTLFAYGRVRLSSLQGSLFTQEKKRQ